MRRNASILMLVMVVSACGARHHTPAPASAAPTPTGAGAAGSPARQSDPGVSADEILIGSSATLSGPTGFLGDELTGAVDAYFETVNARGGIGGRKLKLITYDDGGDPTKLLTNFRRLVEQDHVVALVTGFGDVALDYVARQKVPTIVFGVTPSSFASKYPTVYPVVGNALLWTQEFIAGLKSKGLFKRGMKVGMIYDNTLIDISPYLPELKQSWENAGAKVVSVDPFSLSTGSCDSLVLKYRDLGVDWWDFQSAAWFTCVQSAQRQDWKPTIGWGNWPASVPTTATIAGPLAAGIWAGSNGDQPNGAPRRKTAAHVEFLTALRRYRPALTSSQHLDSPAVLGYWAAAKLLVAALDAQGPTITKSGINRWIQGVQNFDTGITPPVISMAPNCKTGSEVVWLAPWRWDDKKKEAVRTPATGYFTSPQKAQFGGKCFLTKISDRILSGRS